VPYCRSQQCVVQRLVSAIHSQPCKHLQSSPPKRQQPSCQDRGAALPSIGFVIWLGQVVNHDALTSYYIGQPMRCEVGVAQSRLSDVLSSYFSDVPPVELVRARLTEVSA